MNTKAATLVALTISALLMLSACGGSGSDSVSDGDVVNPPEETVAVVETGVLTDAAVAGVTYTTSPSGKSGITNAKGEYEFEAGDTVIFTVAGLEFPAVTAAGRVTPQTIAEQAFVGSNINEVMLNLAILFQSLDSDGDPSNGITVEGVTILSAAITVETLSSSTPQELATAMASETLPTNAVVPDPVQALTHFYKTELAGNWRLNRIEHYEAGTLSPDNSFDIFISFDAEGRLLWVEYEVGGNPAGCSVFAEGSGYSAIYTGKVAFDEINLIATMQSNQRDLMTNCASGSTDHVADMFDGEIALQGNQLVITHPVENITAYFDRFNNVKDSPVGVWAEMGTTYDVIPGTARNSNGSLNFGDELVGLFSIFTSTQWIHVVLDRAPAGTSCEYNGVYVAPYSHVLTGGAGVLNISAGETLLNHVWVNPASCEKSLPVQEDLFVIEQSLQNDTVWTMFSEEVQIARNLSSAELAGNFVQSVTVE